MRMRTTNPHVCPYEDTVPVRVTTVMDNHAQTNTWPHYSVAELIATQLASGKSRMRGIVLYIPRKVK